jgi:hypothetical protein
MPFNELAVLAAAVSAFILGGLWYGPLFKQAWCRAAGVDASSAPRHPVRVFAVAFLASLIAAAAFAWMIGPAPGLRNAVQEGFLTGLALVAMSFGINYAFAQRSLKLWLIDGGYHTLQFTLYGLVIGLWQ